MTLAQYLQSFLDTIPDKRNQAKTLRLCEKILSQGKNQICAIAKNHAEYMANKRLVSSEVLDLKNLHKCLANQAISFLGNSTDSTNSTVLSKIFLPLDGSEIRKKWTAKSEKLDRVRDLGGGTINGYHSYSTVAVTENSHDVFLLENQLFSTKEEDFLSKNKIVLDLIDSTLEGLKKVSNPKVFLMDREFDNQVVIEHLHHHQNKPNFIIRAKHLNRQTKEGKLDQLSFPKAQLFKIEKLQVKQKVYQDLTLKLTHRKITLVDKYGQETQISVIKSKLLGKNKGPIFKGKVNIENKIENKDGNENENEDFCLLTNLPINNPQELYQAYLNYFIRWKIETVFKFLKETLGMKDFRVEDLQGIKNVVALTFAVGAYMSNLGQISIAQEFLVWLCKLGRGKGKVTKFYAKQGLQLLISHQQVLTFFKQENIPKEKQEELLDLVRQRDV